MVLILSSKHSSFGKSSNLSFFVVCFVEVLLPICGSCSKYECCELKMDELICCYRSKRRRHRRMKNLGQHSKHVQPLVLESNLPPEACQLLDGVCSISFQYLRLAGCNLLIVTKNFGMGACVASRIAVSFMVLVYVILYEN